MDHRQRAETSGDASSSEPEDALLIRHGTTLITALVVGDVLLIGQIGDGGAVLVKDGGEVECPLSTIRSKSVGRPIRSARWRRPACGVRPRWSGPERPLTPCHRWVDQRLRGRRAMACLRHAACGIASATSARAARRVGLAELARSLLGEGQRRRHHTRGLRSSSRLGSRLRERWDQIASRSERCLATVRGTVEHDDARMRSTKPRKSAP